MKKLLSFLMFVFVATPIYADSATIITETTVNLGQDNSYFENLYIGAGTTNISSDVNSDLTIIGGETHITSKVTGDIFVAGGEVTFDGQVEGDLRILGGEVTINGDVVGDLFVIGGQVFVSSDTTLLNDIVLVGGDINFEGDSGKKIKIVSASAKLNGNIDGEAEITSQSLSVGADSKIAGIFSYYSPQKFIKDDGSEITAQINYNEINTIRDTGFIKNAVVNFLNFWLLLRFITMLIIAFVLVSIFKVFSVQVNNIISNSFWKSLLFGFILTFIVPFLIIILMLSLVAIPIGLLLLISFVFVIIIAPATASIFIGSWLKKKFNKSDSLEVNFNNATIGVILFTALQFIPFVGGLLRIIVVFVATGAIFRYVFRTLFK